MTNAPLKVVIRNPRPVRIVVKDVVRLPPVRVAVRGIQGAKGNPGSDAHIKAATYDEINGLFVR